MEYLTIFSPACWAPIGHPRHFSIWSAAYPRAVWAWRQRLAQAVVRSWARYRTHSKAGAGAPGMVLYSTPSARCGAATTGGWWLSVDRIRRVAHHDVSARESA